MSKSLRRAVLLAVFGVALGAAGNLLSPRGIPFITPPKKVVAADEYISLEKAEELWNSGLAFFIDAREPADYAAGHIANALNLPVLEFDAHFGRVAPMLTPQSPIVVYCDGTECELSHRLEDRLRELGHTNTHVLFNGWTVWREAGLPTVTGGAR